MTPNRLSSPSSARSQPSPQQLVTRHNAVVFYGIAAASLLESAMALRAGSLMVAFAGDAVFRSWIEKTWSSAKSAHAQKMRTYIEAMWPEFYWSAAYDEFCADYRRAAPLPRPGHGAALDALALSACAAQAAAFYRSLGAAADDPELRELLLGLAADEAAHFDSFRRCHERYNQHGRLGVLTRYRTIISCATRARDVEVHLAFGRLGGRHWYGNTPFQELSYGEFVTRMGGVVRRHLPLGPAQRLLFKPWLKVHDLPVSTNRIAEATHAPRWNALRLAVNAHSR